MIGAETRYKIARYPYKRLVVIFMFGLPVCKLTVFFASDSEGIGIRLQLTSLWIDRISRSGLSL